MTVKNNKKDTVLREHECSVTTPFLSESEEMEPYMQSSILFICASGNHCRSESNFSFSCRVPQSSS